MSLLQLFKTSPSKVPLWARRLENWCRNDALPYWEANGLDPTGGGYERLHLNGQPDRECPRRVRVQARQAYVYAHAAKLGWHANAKAVSDHYWEQLTGRGLQGGSAIVGEGFKGCAHLLNPDHSLNDGFRDTYAQAFLILAGAWRYMAFKDSAALIIAKQTVGFLDNYAKSDNLGWHEGVPATLPRRQNPHMHLFEAFMALYDATDEQKYLDKAGEIYTLFQRHFFNRFDEGIREYFHQDWTPTSNNGGPFEPGHMMEWCWLVREYEARSGVDVGRYADALYTTGMALGFHKKLGLIQDVVVLHGDIPAPTFRTWPQMEFIKASIAQARTGHKRALNHAKHTIEQTFALYLNIEQKGGWRDKLNERGAQISQHMPASTFYHLMCAASVASEFADQQE